MVNGESNNGPLIQLQKRLEAAISVGALSPEDFPEFSPTFCALLTEKLHSSIHLTERKKRLENILDVLLEYSKLDFSKSATISEKNDEIDAIALGLNTLGEEITYYKNQLEESNQALEMSQRLGKVGSWIYDEPSGKVYLSKSLQDIYGYPESEFDDFWKFINRSVQEDQELLINTVKKVRADHKPFTIHHRAKKPNGEIIYLESRGEVRLKEGKLHKIQGSTMDITYMVSQQKELVNLNNLLHEKQKLLENAQRIAKIGSWKWEIKTNQITWSKALYEIYEVPDKTPLSLEAFQKLLHPDDQGKLNAAIQKCIESGEPYVVKHRILCGDQVKWLEGRGERILKDGELFALQGTGHEITELVENQIRLEELNKTLEKKVKSRTEELEAFTYSVSHDLRAPIRAINGFAEMILEDFEKDLDPEAKRKLGVIKNNAFKMGQLIENLLAFSRLSKFKPKFETVNLNAVLKSSWETCLEHNSHSENVKVEIAELPSIYGNEKLLEQVFINLLGNAIKYSSKEDKPVITVSHEACDKNHTITVSDNGIGFDPKLSDKLFSVFDRLHSDNDFKGLGVGLAMTKRILDKHQASIWGESQPNQGAKFKIAFPKTLL
ncbi:PAS domain-containing sensor histidine kinase [Luteibaculum oceani]|uniref:histidine kinase n=1 Tax=Luteibaculum oceani TaxID=1294296 RepID=A0A5C6VKR6_9FLAO|nr:ATP-binding protein [Luteibaculum oceani]TXC85314.1 hypothetical protein FRX97_01430 [Luteibaculum oceani]